MYIPNFRQALIIITEIIEKFKKYKVYKFSKC